jgi:type V secretory pathway adhesin AidA
MAASALAPLSLGVSEPALGQACGPLDASGSVTCTSVNNNYPSGINYSTANTPINLTLLPGVKVLIGDGGAPIPPSVNAVNAANTTGPTATSAPITITADGVTIDNTLLNNPFDNNKTGLRIQSSGNANITATNSTINLSGTASDFALYAIILEGGASHNASVNLTQGTIVTSSGIESGAIQADNRGNNGNATVVASGAITVTPNPTVPLFTTQYGLLAHAEGNGNASVTFNSGTLDVSAIRPRAILAWTDGNGSSTVTTGAGTVINVSGTQFGGPGVYVFSSAATATALTADVASLIKSVGPANTDPSNLPVGIRANNSGTAAPIVVNYSGPGITVEGGNGVGILAQSGSGSINVMTFPGTGPIKTTGEFSSGIVAITGGNAAVNIASGVSVMGGWQAGLTGGSGPFNLPAAGVILNPTGGTGTLTNNGIIGALSDRAVAGDPQVINNGTITGFVQFTGGDNSILNNGLFDLRHFADTDGDTVRDTLRVAIADLGNGPNNSFTNNGTLRLPAVTGATTLVNTGQYLPLGNPNNAMALGGPLQGHLIGVTTFTNSGTIDLWSNPVAGDVLVITGERLAGVAGPGNFPGTFISNGGTLRLDTVLNEGGAATRSDTLVVDGTSVGPGGATGMAIRNAGGTGALTVGDGILVVQALNPARSAAGAFSLNGGSITAGAFDYVLFKGGGSPGSQGNWYLRSTLVAPSTPDTPTPEPAPGSPPLPTPVPGAAPIPLFQPGVAVMSVVPSVARTLGLLTLGTFNERQGDQLLVRGGCSRETQNRSWKADKSITGDENCFTRFGVWGRVFGQNTREHFAQGARPDFDGTFAGFQAGADLLRFESINGHSDHVGFYVAQARASGSVHGLVDGFEGALAGHLDLDATSYGGYWTHLGPSNWYIDAVVQGTHFDGTPTSIRGISTTAKGDAFAGSIEAGYPITLAPWLRFEPQVQGIWQRVWLNDALVPSIATISFDRADVFTGRAGALLRGTFGSTGGVWQPYLKGNVWWGSNGFDTVAFNSFGIPTGRNGGTTLEGGGGVTGKLTRYVSVYGDASYLTGVSGESRDAIKGLLGALHPLDLLEVGDPCSRLVTPSRSAAADARLAGDINGLPAAPERRARPRAVGG